MKKLRTIWLRIVMPKEGSIYTYRKRGSAYNGMTGVVEHHLCGDAFMIRCETNILAGIRPLFIR